jgi:hypothetical protein
MKRPAFQFYPADWLRDTALRSCSAGARGLWMDMICFMHEGNPYGFLKVKQKVILPTNLARMCGLTLQETEGYLSELHDAGVYDVDQAECIYSRRMIRDEEVRNARSEGGKRGGNPSLMGHKVNHEVNHEVGDEVKRKPTPSSSSSIPILCASLPTREQVLAAAELQGIDARIAGIWFDETDSRPISPTGEWTDRNGRPISRWQSALAAYASKWVANQQKRPSGTGVRPPSVWEAKQRIDALKRKIDAIRSNPANKIRKPDSWDTVLTASAKAEVADLKTKLAEQERLVAA